MALLFFDKVSLEFGDQPLLSKADFNIETGERVCLIGRNGAGKSSMLKLITGQLAPDDGEIQFRQNLRISRLEQALPDNPDQTVREVVTQGMAGIKKLIDEYNRISKTKLDENKIHEIEALQQQIDAAGGWHVDRQVDTTMTQLGLEPERKLKELSGGWRRRVSLGKALVSHPDLLLLDEPTNHLDINTIEWLEQQIRGFQGSVLFITHDRRYMQRLATRIVELDRGRLTSWPGNYRDYLRLKEKSLEEESRRNALFDKKLAEEEAWIRQGIKARRTRNEGRVRALLAMREERAQRIPSQNKARVHIEEADRSGRKVIEVRNVTHGYHGKALIKNFSLKIMRGDRVALIGNNGVGKSTLLRILLGDLQPDEGSVKHGTNLEIAYFDQLRRELDPEKTIAETVGDGRDYIKLYGKDRHVIGYLKDFLFSPKRAMTPVKALSGGEWNRVILAKLFTRPANLIVLDEPTNDLDIEMLEVLEQRLVDYKGTLIVVSHDRDFIDNVATSTLVFEGDGKVQEYVGGYSDWSRRGKTLAEADESTADPVNAEAKSKKNIDSAGSAKRKLSYKLQRELDMLPGKIESLEKELQLLQSKVADAGFYSQPETSIKSTLKHMADTEQALEQAMERWSELESM